METTSVIILNGFLGAGKTTLLKNLLIQAHEKQLSVSVIVNDMSELDVDGVLIANTDIVDAKDNNFVSITADSISSPAGLKKMDLAINHLLDHNKPDVMLIETSGSSHPLPLVKYLRRHSRVRLKAFLTLVDTVMACKFFPGPVSRIAGMPDTAPSGAVFFIPSAIFTPLPDYAVTHRTARLTSALHTPPVPACASSRRESPFLSCH